MEQPSRKKVRRCAPRRSRRSTLRLSRAARFGRRGGVTKHDARPSQPQAAARAKHAALLVLLCAAAAAAETRPGGHMAHAAARAGGVTVTPARGDYIGTPMQTYSSAVCSNSLTCSPSQCVKGSNTACAVSNNLGTTSNKTNSAMAATLATIASRTCTVSSDARCSAQALAAVFGHYPGILAAYCNDGYLVLHSSGLAAHPTSLGSIYTPPGGGTCLSGAASCGYLDQVRAWCGALLRPRP